MGRDAAAFYIDEGEGADPVSRIDGIGDSACGEMEVRDESCGCEESEISVGNPAFYFPNQKRRYGLERERGITSAFSMGGAQTNHAACNFAVFLLPY